ncbi:protease-associated domain-containing protein 1-like isoform X2 [Lineus longissimus]|uniref:protease-associated domain-containing protein 1-like isoform X2 n=1 Tax=Lineus longissimus TaxID=88925 RepID=UPI00315C6712
MLVGLLILQICGQHHNTILKTVSIEDDLFFQILEPESLRYLYRVRPAKNFGGSFHKSLHRIPLVPTVPEHGCSPISNGILIKDNVALVLRGGCSFVTKTLNAEAAGAVAVIITDKDVHEDKSMIDMIEDGTSRQTTIPSLFMVGKNGWMIRQKLDEVGVPNAIIDIPVNVTFIPNYALNQPPWTFW